MRGVISAGMVAALETLRLTQCFDAVYGSSAGAINGAYFLAGQARYGTTIYYENIDNQRFINFGRFITGDPVVSLEFLLDNIAERVKPLQWERVVNSEVPLVAMASSLVDKKATPLRNFADKTDLKECLRASARIPGLAGKPVRHRGMVLLDAIVYEDIPLRAALDDGCTHLMALMTLPRDKTKRGLTYLERQAIAIFTTLEGHASRRSYLRDPEKYHENVQTLASGRFCYKDRIVSSLAVQLPAGQAQVKGTEIRPRLLMDGARAGFEAVYAALGLSKPEVVEVLTAY